VIPIRHVASDDWPEWRRLRRQALDEAPYAFGSTLSEWSGTGDSEERWRNRLESVAVNLIAYWRDAAAGMVSVTAVVSREAEIISMWVAPSARGHGVGDALVRAAIDHARDQEAARVALDVTAGNKPAIDLYLRAGFVDVGWASSPKDPRPERRMVLEL
jgi:ribosomal protein S18 acetylase RimI-like enzyme